MVSCDPDAGSVTLKDGTVLRGDVIVGADGIKSNLRKHVLGHEVQAQPTGFSAYRLMVQTSELEEDEAFCQFINHSHL